MEILFLYLTRLSSSSWLEEQMFLTILLLYYSNKNSHYVYWIAQSLKFNGSIFSLWGKQSQCGFPKLHFSAHFGASWYIVDICRSSPLFPLTVNCRASDRQSDTYAQNFGAEAGSYRPFRLALLVSYAFDHLDTS